MKRSVATALVAGFATLLNAALFDTPVQQTDIDRSATADWSDGLLRTNPQFYSYPPVNQPEWVLFTQTSKPVSGWQYGASTNPGPRHVRLGFNRSIPVGTVLALGDSTLSILASNAIYPGDITNELDWVPAQRLNRASFATNPPSLHECSIWVLPPGTETRALRFSHFSAVSDPVYQGTISGAYVLSNRFNDLAPQGTAVAESNSVAASLLNDYLLDAMWDNGALTGAPVVSSAWPQQIFLLWPTNVLLSGLCLLNAAFSQTAVDFYAGPPDLSPREAPESNWVSVATYTNIHYQVPRLLTANWLEFASAISTRAIRMRIIQASDPVADAYYNSYGGTRVGLGELIALSPLGNSGLETSILRALSMTNPPIPVPFVLESPGFVTLVIDDPSGRRVRNLVSETAFPAGTNVTWWDGLDESGRVDAGPDGIYQVQGNLVSPGTYVARGLVRGQLDLSYQFTVGTAGQPPWRVSNQFYGGWLADHRPPSDVIFLPGTNAQMLIASEVAEAGDGLVWTDLQGNKLIGRTALAPAGFYTGSHLAFDAGASAVPGVAAYSGYALKQIIYFYGVAAVTGNPITLPSLQFTNASAPALTGLAVRDGLLFASVGTFNQVFALNTRSQTILAANSILDPRGLAFDQQGRLLILSQSQLLRCLVDTNRGALSAPEIVLSGLDDPRKLTLDAAGNFYISQWGSTHQVGVFAAQGGALRSIGVKGVPAAGPYNPNHMNHPNGVAIASDGRLWVAEYDYVPKRISIWNTNGTLDNALYGPPKYGGGGRLDPLDKTRFYYGDWHEPPLSYYFGMEYHLDWATGSNYLATVYYRADTNGFYLPYCGPETALYVNGRQYMVNSLNADPTTGGGVAGIWQMRNSVAVPVAAVGNSLAWDWLGRPEFVSRFPPGGALSNTIFVWSDLNDDGIAQAQEVTFLKVPGSSFYVNRDLSIISGRALAFSPTGFTPQGAPIYDLSNATTIISGVVPSSTSGGGQLFAATNGFYVLTGGPMTGYLNGQVTWTYPSQWPSLHASHLAPLPSYPGELIGTTRLLSMSFTPDVGDAGEIWAVNGNLGNCYLLTVDGLFIATLFKDIRTAPPWSMPQPVPGMLVNNVSLFDECFWPSISKTSDGNVYICAGKTHSSIVKLNGLETIRRLPPTSFSITTQQLAAASAWTIASESARRSILGRDTIAITSFSKPPAIDGLLAEWTNAMWIQVDDRVTAAIGVGQGNLYFAFQTGDSSLLANTGLSTDLLFQSGGALDLMIGTTDPAADPQRTAPVAGDLRLLVAVVNGTVKAVRYRPVVPGTVNPVPFSSPLGTVFMDSVDDISSSITLAAGNNGIYELSVPLTSIYANPSPGQTILGDIGVLRGNGGQTVQRVYWENKSTALVSDIPSEAQLSPQLWGLWHFPLLRRPPALSNLNVFGNSCSLTVNADSGSYLVIEDSTNLTSWTSVTNLTIGPSPSYLNLPTSPNEPQRFFRAVLP